MEYTWEEIKKLKDEYVIKAKSKIPFVKGDIIEIIETGKKGRVYFVSFDEEKGEAFFCIKINRHHDIGWISTRDGKNKFYQSELNEIRKIKNPISLDRLDELQQQLEELDDLPLKKYERESEQYRLENEIRQEQYKCVHVWDDGSETGNKYNGDSDEIEYTCKICGYVGYNSR